MGVLRELKREGKIKRIGFSGMSLACASSSDVSLNVPPAYPLPTLLRIALLVLHHSKEPVDIIQTYSHQNLQNTGLSAYLTEFKTRAKVQTVMNASPLNMGLLTTSGPPTWHPASPELRQCAIEAKEIVKASGLTVGDGKPAKIEDLAVSFGMRDLDHGETPPVVVGCSTLDQVRSCVVVKHVS